MRTVLNVLNFVLGGFATTLPWLFATLVSIVLIFTLPLTRSCWEITKLSFVPYGNEAIHVDELNPESKNALMNTGGTLLNILWLIFFGCGSASCIFLRVLRSASRLLVFRWGSRTLRSPLSLFGPSGAGLFRSKWPRRRVKPMRVVVFSN